VGELLKINYLTGLIRLLYNSVVLAFTDADANLKHRLNGCGYGIAAGFITLQWIDRFFG